MPTAHNLLRRVLPALAMAALWVAPTPAAAANNNQTGLVNVFLPVGVQAPASVSVPVSVAANVCGVDVAVLATQLGSGPVSCNASSTSLALNQAIANAMTTGGGGGGSNNQSGLVNVFVPVGLQIPIAVAVPIGVAANVCGINAAVLAAQSSTSPVTCTASSTSNALNRAIAAGMTVA